MIMYIDPGTGSFIAQAVIAALLGFMFAFRTWLRGVWMRLRGKKEEDGED